MLEDIPFELFLEIARHLNAGALCSLRRVSKQLNLFASSRLAWEGRSASVRAPITAPLPAFLALNELHVRGPATDADAMAVAASRQLTRVIFADISDLSDSGVAALATATDGCGAGLQSLALLGTSQLTAAALASIADGLPALERLDVRLARGTPARDVDSALIRLARAHAELSVLRMHADGVGVRGLQACVCYMPRLTELLLVGGVFHRQSLACLRAAESLRSLSLRYARVMNVGGGAPEPIGRLLPPAGLEKIDLSGCSWVDDEDILSLVPFAPTLRELWLRLCRRASAGAIATLVRSLPHLHGLYLGWTATDDGSFASTSSSAAEQHQPAQSLKVVDVSACIGVTIEGLENLADACPHLNRVWVRYSPRISAEDLDVFASHHPGLKIIASTEAAKEAAAAAGLPITPIVSPATTPEPASMMMA